jgi:shikimate kinase
MDHDQPFESHIVLVGLMGVGKTSVGRRLARRISRPFVDTDEYLERQSGRSIPDIFEADGEATFRDLETAVLRELLARAEPQVIATGGGIVVREENRELLAASGARTVWLCARIETLSKRLTFSRTPRPLLSSDPDAVLRRLSLERDRFYREVANACVCVDGRNVAEVVEAVLR